MPRYFRPPRFSSVRRAPKTVRASASLVGALGFAGVALGRGAGAVGFAEGASAVYPPFVVTGDEELLVATTRFDGAWEGPPDLVHGGYLAAGFDMVLSSMAHRVLGHSVTRRLQVRYLKPTFLGSELRYEVEASEPRGRLLSLTGRLYADDRLTMRASAEFASLDQARFADRRG